MSEGLQWPSFLPSFLPSSSPAKYILGGGGGGGLGTTEWRALSRREAVTHFGRAAEDDDGGGGGKGKKSDYSAQHEASGTNRPQFPVEFVNNSFLSPHPLTRFFTAELGADRVELSRVLRKVACGRQKQTASDFQ